MIARKRTIGRFRIACAIMTLGLLAQVPALAAAPANWRINPARTHIAFAIDAVGLAIAPSHYLVPRAIAVGGRRLPAIRRLFAFGRFP